MDRHTTEISHDLIQTLWNSIDTNMWHGMSCRCCGGGMFTMNARVLEADLLDYLADKYQSDDLRPLKEAVNEHADHLDKPLPAWLRALEAQNTIPTPLMQQLKSDVMELLKNLQGGRKY
ncbi:MAG: hypothetical protein CL536_04845 [Alcaligenaceae bacterium]|nr:hypothetical protein [Alcaligenaceae bacterium]